MPRTDYERILESSKILVPHTKKMLVAFPGLKWDLRKAGYDIEAEEYLAMILFVPLSIFVILFILAVVAFIAIVGSCDLLVALEVSAAFSLWSFIYLLIMPKIKIKKKAREIDKDLNFMLRDLQIQLSSGIPIFDAIVNIAAGGYGECSNISNDIVDDIQSGRHIIDVLNEFGIMSASENLRRSLSQITNSMITGSDMRGSLRLISSNLQQEKEDKIKRYANELAMWGLIYMMVVVVAPSMGVALLLILSSFMGGKMITEGILALIAVGVVLLEIVFISIIRAKRPDID
ncbi:MAG: type II secretion system F family protein [Candidatus Altiarchaeales archaeon]|nr:type II secretion system F family protein [Candidatus Altiarchaeales archaeon]